MQFNRGTVQLKVVRGGRGEDFKRYNTTNPDTFPFFSKKQPLHYKHTPSIHTMRCTHVYKAV